jgi:hypothetical protein
MIRFGLNRSERSGLVETRQTLMVLRHGGIRCSSIRKPSRPGGGRETAFDVSLCPHATPAIRRRTNGYAASRN